MPILKRATEVFPPDLFDLPLSRFPWWVAYVRSRQEKALARYLLFREVPFYLPQREHRIRRGGRSFVSYLPLFPGYVFFRGLALDRHVALRSDLIVKTLDVPDPGLLNRELSQLRALQESGASLIPCQRFSPGDAVRITHGPFQGYTGRVLRCKGGPRLVVSISLLRQSVAVDFEQDVLARFMERDEVGRSAIAS